MSDIIHTLKNKKLADIENDSNVQRLAGDASERKYFRIKDSAQNCYVLMVNNEPFDKNNFYYLVQYKLFSGLGFPVADIKYTDEKKGWIVLEDLGDITLQAYLQTCSKSEMKKLYKRAIDLLLRFHSIDESIYREHQLAFLLEFDTKKLYDELLFFYDNFICRLLNYDMNNETEAIIKSGFYEIAHYLARRPKVMCHRDYHSRNIMIKDEQIYLVDFQDARRGPYTYDIISLLRDSYVEIDEKLRNELLDYYLEEAHLADDKEIEKELLFMSLQRNIKALGTFAFQYCQKGKKLYLDFIPRTIRYIIEKLSVASELGYFRIHLEKILNAWRNNDGIL